MRFLLYFILSGFIYYGLYHYTPEFFEQLIGIADMAFKYSQAFFTEVMNRVRGVEAATQMLPFFGIFRSR